MTANIRLDQYLSKARDRRWHADTERRYLICSSPRCGSTLFGQMLFDTGAVGDPLEYLNPAYVAAFFRRFPTHSNNVEDILATLQRLRSGPSGLFGVQIHFSHFNGIFPKEEIKIQFLRTFEHFIFIRRRNKLAQAASLYRADNSGVWSSLEEDIRVANGLQVPETDNAISATGLTRALASVVSQDEGWESLLTSLGIPFLTVFYEDLIADWNVQCAKAIAWLGEQVAAEDVPPPGLRRQGVDDDASLLSILDYLGCRISV